MSHVLANVKQFSWTFYGILSIFTIKLALRCCNFFGYSKVPPLRNCIIRNSGLISLNKIHLYKKLYRLIHVQFLLQWYIVIFYAIHSNMSPMGLSSLEKQMKILSPNCYNFKKLSIPAQTIRFLYNSAHFKNAFLTNLIAVWKRSFILCHGIHTLSSGSIS